MTPSSRRVYLTVAASAILVYLGALRHGFALDDVPIIATNPLVHRWAGFLEAFAAPYWPPATGAAMYRPLTIASFALDWQSGQLVWLHAVNVLWHAAVSVTVAALVRRWSDSTSGALLAGMVFAVHPVHVEAVANLVGRAEVLASLFALLSVYAALERDQLAWSLVALTLGLLSKETAASVPGLIAAGWLTGVGHRPTRRRLLEYVAGWVGVALCYGVVRWWVLHPYADQVQVAPVFVGASFVATRLTAVGSFADVARLLLFPAHLRVDYSPAERTLLTTPLDAHFLLGALCLGLWAALIVVLYRRRPTIAFGLVWTGVALLPVANMLFLTGVLVAERTLYLPSAGLAIALGAAAGKLRNPRVGLVAAAIVLVAGVRTALRVPIWRDSASVLHSVVRDSPRSYVASMWAASAALAQHRPADALRDYRAAAAITTNAPKLLMVGADAAFTLGDPQLADSALARLDQLCRRCPFYYEFEARAARARGDTAVADSFTVRARRLPAP
ncbi:MAG TPA: hypothetical protein VFI79_07500 [Gemmatimonadales bacterium]|nr:hypothetical protein [Gemmatimonadales bacterium]